MFVKQCLFVSTFSPMMYRLSVCVLFLLLSIFCVYAQTEDGDGEQQNQQQTDQEELDVALNEGLKPFYKMTHLFLEYIQPNNISAEILSKELKGRSLLVTSNTNSRLQDWCQCYNVRGNSLALCYLAVVMELPDSLWMNCKSEFGVIFLRCSPM